MYIQILRCLGTSNIYLLSQKKKKKKKKKKKNFFPFKFGTIFCCLFITAASVIIANSKKETFSTAHYS
jgi:hypothetical protein